MAAPTNPYTAITPAEIQAGKPGRQELWEKYREQILRLYEILLADGVDPDDAAILVGHRHRGKAVDGTEVIDQQPQENLVDDGDGIGPSAGAATWSTATDVDAGKIAFHNGGPTTAITPRRLIRSDGNPYEGTAKAKDKVFRTIIPPVNKIKSAGGLGRFTCSLFVRRTSLASGVVGGAFNFGLDDGTNFITDAFATVDFDDVETEFQRFYFTTEQIARPAALRFRMDWSPTQPTDWDTVNNGDIIGYLGGAMLTNGSGLSKFDISHLDGGGDTYLVTPTDDEVYWWDEVIDEVLLTV